MKVEKFLLRVSFLHPTSQRITPWTNSLGIQPMQIIKLDDVARVSACDILVGYISVRCLPFVRFETTKPSPHFNNDAYCVLAMICVVYTSLNVTYYLFHYIILA